MAVSVYHVKTSTIPDDADTSLIRPSDWNSAHIVQFSQDVVLNGNTAGVSSVAGDKLYLQGGNNVTLSGNGSTVVINAAAGGGGGGGSFSAGVSTGGNSLGQTGTVSNQVVFVGGNNVTLSQATGAGGATITFSGPNTVAQSAFVFSNSNNVSFGTNGSTVTATATFAQSADTNKAGTGFTSTTTNGSQLVGTLGTNGISLGVPAWVTAAGAGDGNNVIGINGNATQASTTYVFSNGNNVSFGLNAGTVTASASYSQSTQPVAYSAANGSAAFSTLSFANSNGVSFSSGTQGLYATVKTDYQSSNANYLTSQSNQAYSAANGSATFQTLSFANSNGVSFSSGTQGLYATVKTDYQSSNANYLTSQSNQAYSGANGSATFQTLSFANSNGVSFSTGTQGLYATVKTDYLTTARASNDAVGLNTAATNVTWTVNSGGISLNAGAYLTTAMQSNASTQFVQANAAFNGTNISGTIASNGLSLSVGAGGAADGYNSAQFTNSTANSTMPLVWAGNSNGSGNVTVGLTGSTITMSAPSGGGGGAAISAGANSQNTGTVIFSNSNGISFGLNAGTLTASYTVPTQTAQPVAYSAANGSANFSTITFANSNGVSFSTGTQGLYATVKTDYLTTAALSNHSHNFATTTTNGSQIVVGTTNSAGATIGVPPFITTYVGQTTQTQPAGNIAGVGTTFGGTNVSGSMTFNSNGLVLSLSAPTPGGGGAINVTAGTTSGNLQTIQFDNANGVSFGLNGSTVTASVNAGGGGGLTREYFDNLGPLNTISGAMGTKQVQHNQVQFFPLKPFQDLFNGSMTLNTMLIDLSVSGSTATLSAAGISTVVRFGLYGIVTTGASLSASLINSFGTTLGLAAASSNNSTFWNGQRWLSVHSSQWSSQPVLSDNRQYICGIHWSSIGSSAQTFAMLGGFMGSTAARSGFLGQATSNATHNGNVHPFMGVYGTTTVALPENVNYRQINKQSASANFVPHIIGHTYSNLTMM